MTPGYRPEDNGVELYRGPLIVTSPRRPRGNQTTYDPDIARQLIEKISNGETIFSAAQELGVLSSAVHSWADDNARSPADREGFGVRLTRARLYGCHAINDQCLDIADDARNDWMTKFDPHNAGWYFNGEHATRTRLRLEQRRFYLAKIAPKVFGDKLDLTVKPEPEPGLTVKELSEATPQQLEALEQAARICAAAGVRIEVKGFVAAPAGIAA